MKRILCWILLPFLLPTVLLAGCVICVLDGISRKEIEPE
jgi:hypothetical protein